MKVLVTGGSGLLGRAIVLKCKSKLWDVIPLAYSRVAEGMVKVDIRNSSEVDAIIGKEKPDFVIHAAAERFPDRVENDYENTRNLNIKASSDITSTAKKYGSRVLYISTDYVFEGSKPPYKVEDEAKPLNKYGMTKLEGEAAVIAADSGSLVLRIPVLYGPVETLKESAVTCLLSAVKDSSKKAAVSHYEKRYPEHVNAIADIICQLLEKAKEDTSVKGIYQWSGTEQLTKYDMCVAIAEVFGLDHGHLIADDKAVPGAVRPYDSQMDNSKLEEIGIKSHVIFKEGIKECLQKWV